MPYILQRKYKQANEELWFNVNDKVFSSLEAAEASMEIYEQLESNTFSYRVKEIKYE